MEQVDAHQHGPVNLYSPDCWAASVLSLLSPVPALFSPRHHSSLPIAIVWCMLQADGCISIGENDEIESLTMGRICSFYYLKHQTMGLFATTLKPEMDFKQVCLVVLQGAGGMVL